MPPLCDWPLVRQRGRGAPHHPPGWAAACAPPFPHPGQCSRRRLLGRPSLWSGNEWAFLSCLFFFFFFVSCAWPLPIDPRGTTPRPWCWSALVGASKLGWAASGGGRSEGGHGAWWWRPPPPLPPSLLPPRARWRRGHPPPVPHPGHRHGPSSCRPRRRRTGRLRRRQGTPPRRSWAPRGGRQIGGGWRPRRVLPRLPRPPMPPCRKRPAGKSRQPPAAVTGRRGRRPCAAPLPTLREPNS